MKVLFHVGELNVTSNIIKERSIYKMFLSLFAISLCLGRCATFLEAIIGKSMYRTNKSSSCETVLSY